MRKPIKLGVFKFKHFTVFQNKHSLPVGTDAMLLGALAHAIEPKVILDAGAGCGVLGMMMAQKYPMANVECIELDPNATKECEFNISHSPFHNRIEVKQGDFLAMPLQAYDLIISNPPYYFSNNTSSDQNALQKHASEGQFIAWIQRAKEILNPTGHFWIIYPSSIASFVLKNTQLIGLNECQQIKIENQHGVCNRIISCYQHSPKISIQTKLQIRNLDGSYTEEYKVLTKEFHTKAPIR